mgnify:CR=1 FL=1
MCRLLGFAAAGSNTSLNGVLGMQAVRDFRNLSEIHNDGWGSALVTVPSESPYLRDGGAPTPETGTAVYKNTIAARHDPIFDELANTPARGGLWHLRLASSNLPLILENQQPFYANGLSFIHNGDISDDQGRNIITNRAFPVDPNIVQSTGGRSDSAIFFAVILQYIGFGFALDEAVAQAVRELRKSYPKSSYNCMIQSQDQFIALCAAGREVTSKRIVEIYDQYGRGDQAHDYRVMRYRTLGESEADQAAGQPKGVVVASSGFDQCAEDGWTCTETIEMCDEPARAIRSKKDSSIVVGLNLLKEGKGDAFVSAGSTGALHVGASLIVRTLKGVKRPALATMVPAKNKAYLLLDCGANVECRPEMLAAFAVMGSCYVNKVEGRTAPTVALANNGAEESKGTRCSGKPTSCSRQHRASGSWATSSPVTCPTVMWMWWSATALPAMSSSS